MSDPKYDTFVNDLADLREDHEIVLTVRDLTPGIYKYMCKSVKARVSSSPDKYPEGLAIRFGRGQLYKGQYSIKVLEEVRRIPEKYD